MKYTLLIFSLVCFSLSAQEVIIVDTNTGKEYEKNFPSRTNVIPDLENHLKVYYVLQKQRPSYDHLTEKLVPVKRFTDSIAYGNSYPYVVKEWQKVKLPDVTIQQRKELEVLRKENELLMNSVSDAEFKQYVSIALAAMIYQSRGGVLTPKQNQIINTVFNFGLKAYQNFQVKEKLLQDIQTNPGTDINGNWVP